MKYILKKPFLTCPVGHVFEDRLDVNYVSFDAFTLEVMKLTGIIEECDGKLEAGSGIHCWFINSHLEVRDAVPYLSAKADYDDVLVYLDGIPQRLEGLMAFETEEEAESARDRIKSLLADIKGK